MYGGGKITAGTTRGVHADGSCQISHAGIQTGLYDINSLNKGKGQGEIKEGRGETFKIGRFKLEEILRDLGLVFYLWEFSVFSKKFKI